MAAQQGIGMRWGGLILGCALSASGGPVEDLAAWLKLARNSRPALEAQAFARAPLTAARCVEP